MKMLLDIGNTCTDILELGNELIIKKIRTNDVVKFIKKYKTVPMYISCVVKKVEQDCKTAKLQKFVTYKDLKDNIHCGREKSDIKIKYDTKNVGVDRLLNILAAQKFVGNNTVVISCGTALVLDYLNKEGEFVGGEIFPGIDLITKNLYENTSKLPYLKNIKYLFQKNKLIGNNTEECIVAGITNFYSSGINNFIQKLSPKNVIITGGDAETVAKLINVKKLYLIQNLVLLGLTILGVEKDFLTEEEYIKITSLPELKYKK